MPRPIDRHVDVMRASPEATHPTLYASMTERVDYACVVGAFMNADEPLTPDDRVRLRELCHEIGIPPTVVERVDASIGEPPERLRERLFRLRDSTLRLMLVRDMIELGYADGRYDISERRRVRGMSALMLVGEDKIKKLEDEVCRELYGAPADEPAEEPAGPWSGMKRLLRRMFGPEDEDA